LKDGDFIFAFQSNYGAMLFHFGDKAIRR